MFLLPVAWIIAPWWLLYPFGVIICCIPLVTDWFPWCLMFAFCTELGAMLPIPPGYMFPAPRKSRLPWRWRSLGFLTFLGERVCPCICIRYGWPVVANYKLVEIMGPLLVTLCSLWFTDLSLWPDNPDEALPPLLFLPLLPFCYTSYLLNLICYPF